MPHLRQCPLPSTHPPRRPPVGCTAERAVLRPSLVLLHANTDSAPETADLPGPSLFADPPASAAPLTAAGRCFILAKDSRELPR